MARPRSDLPQPATAERRMDAAVILPAVGAVLVFVPLLWPTGAEDAAPVATSSAAIYLFAVWGLMILAAGALSFVLRRPQSGDRPNDVPK